MARTTNRRELICDAAIRLLAAGGGNTLSHQAIDRQLEFPAGSTSYYFRTRRALVAATIEHLTLRSRAAFLGAQPDGVDTKEAAREFIAAHLAGLIATRRTDVAARYALMMEVASDAHLSDALAGCFFSHVEAARLFTGLADGRPDQAAADLIALLEGLVFDYVCGRRRGAAAGLSRAQLRTELAVPIGALLTSRS